MAALAHIDNFTDDGEAPEPCERGSGPMILLGIVHVTHAITESVCSTMLGRSTKIPKHLIHMPRPLLAFGGHGVRCPEIERGAFEHARVLPPESQTLLKAYAAAHLLLTNHR